MTKSLIKQKNLNLIKQKKLNIKKKEQKYRAKKLEEIKLIDLKLKDLDLKESKIAKIKFKPNKLKKTRTKQHRYKNYFKSYIRQRIRSTRFEAFKLNRRKYKLYSQLRSKISRKNRIRNLKAKLRFKPFKKKFDRKLRHYNTTRSGFFKRFRILLAKLEKKIKNRRNPLYCKLATKIKNYQKNEINIFLDRNILNRSYFARVVRTRMLKNTRYRRVNVRRPKFNRTIKKERSFYYKTRKALIKTKRYLYKQQYPKIRGKKNPNFNYAYFNNIERNGVRLILGRLVITYLHNNTFINIHNSAKMLKVISGGKIGLKGPKRATPHSRQVVMKKAVEFLLKSEINILDVYLNSNYSKWYTLMLKEFNKPMSKPYYIRYLLISNPRAHGHIRDKKKRRK